MVKQMAFWLMAGWGAVAWAQADGSAKPMFKVGEVAVYTVNQRGDNKVFEEVTTVTAVTPDAIRFNHVRPNREPAALEDFIRRKAETIYHPVSTCRMGTDEGAVVVVPVVAIFLIGAALILGAGSLAMLFFGWDVLLAVAVELAFSVATARAAMGVEREGWLGTAVRLTWKPLLGALLCAVLLGATIDHVLPQANSLPEAVRIIRGL